MKCWTIVALVGLFMGLGLVGCSKRQSGGTGQAGLGSVTGSVAGVRWSVPKRWTEMGERAMRVATYAIPAAEGDPEAGECAVSYFGSGQGGDVDANIDRWVGQFEVSSVPGKVSREVNGVNVTIVQIAGIYLAPAGPMMQSQGRKENYRLLGAIIAAPQGSVFFKCTGPAKTVGSAEAEFDAMVGSLAMM